jgi:signal transduction histidine kinase
MNAIDAMGTAGSLTLRTYESPGERTACLEIEDSGGGIARADLPRIFDPFFTTKPTGQGTGLGLSTSFGIVRDNEGDIQVKKTGPKGTTFLVKLPLAGFNTTGMPESVG